ncbi:MAG: hypothetical protein H6605_01005 [Flavobacteriales bacterium]|nr:hypothetical protein [Flavobacteriales bacterium]
MKNTITEELLLQFIYGEVDTQTSNHIQSLLISDKELQNKHSFLIQSIGLLGKETLNPDETNIKIILEEATLSKEEIF